MRVPRSLLLVIGFLCALASGAWAQNIKEQAKQHVADGLAAQKAGRFDDAVAAYQRAYDLVPHPELLFNLGQAYRLKGDRAAAIAHYERYLAIEPKGRLSKEAKAWLKKLSAEQSAEDKRQAEEARKAEEARQADEARKAEEARVAAEQRKAADEQRRAAEKAAADERARRAAEMPPEPPDPVDPPTERGGGGLRLLGIAGGATGVLVLGAGIYFGMQAQSISDDLSGHDASMPWTPDELAKQDDGKRAETLQIALTAGGAAFVVAGAALYYVGRKQGRSVTIAPAGDGGEGATVVVGGTW